MKKQDNTRIMGRFRFRVIDPARRLIREWTVPNMVVDTGLAWIAGALSGDVADPSLAKYIGIGTGTTAAAADDTELETEVESRATGTQSRITTDTTDDTYKCVGEITMTSSRSITEVGIFTDATAGTLFSRSVFPAEVVGSGNSLEVTYECDIDRP